MKKLSKAALIISVAALIFAGCAKKESGTGSSSSGAVKNAAGTSGGKVLNIYVWNEEFQSRFNDFYAKKLPSDVTVNWVITPNQGNAYQNKLDETLILQDKAAANDKIDIFLVEADYALKYVDTDYTLDVTKEIGLSDADLSQQY